MSTKFLTITANTITETAKVLCAGWLILASVLISCTDQINYDSQEYGPEGEYATISLNFGVAGMTRLTRADEDNDYSRVKTLWVGIYNAATGERTFGGMMTEDANGFAEGNDHTLHSLKNIETKSGKSYIVAVANPDNYTGFTLSTSGDYQKYTPLDELLDNALKWDDYKSIIITGSIIQDSHIDIQAPVTASGAGLIMSGIYDQNPNPESAVHPVVEESPVYISAGENSLNGAIHLRLLQSHINFTLEASGDIVEITPQSYQVYNVPFASWLHEHTSASDIQNAGDAMEPDFSKNSNYPSSLVFTSTSFTKDETNVNGITTTTYSFDFWQMENKRTGLDICKEYSDREKEYGTDGTYDPSGSSNYRNSGLFMSLTPFDNPSLNNMATYIDIPCIVKYRESTSEDTAKPDGVGDTDGLLQPGAVRSANITYRVHLGYVNPKKDPKDFNCFRNSEYTYRMTVSNLHNVIVEAFRVGDNQPGAFGDVTDVSDTFFQLDAHYGVFNIFLSDDDLKAFSFRMLAYEKNSPTEITGEKGAEAQINSDNWKYYNWISLLYTNNTDPNSETQKKELTQYPGSDSYEAYSNNSAKLLYLNDFVPNQDGSVKQKAGWYTVFINEYTYENSPNEKASNWHDYVNQPDRMFWINVAQKISADGSSVFFKAKYAGSQHSIQTYYTTNDDTETAIGVEYENENLGMNLRWTSDVGSSNLDRDNGRANIWNLVSGKEWDDFIKREEWQKVNPISNRTVTAALPSRFTEDQIKGGYRNVPMMNLLSINDNISMGGTAGPYNNASICSATQYDPQTNHATAQFVQTMYSCMNRNRDENGDGIIDASELKWYLPASGKYLRIILGRNSLPSPVMTYINNEELPYTDKAQNGMFLYLSSDNKVIWTVEGLSSSNFYKGNPYCSPPWQIRCIRDLGTDLTDTSKDNVTPAYEGIRNGTSAVVKVVHYYGSSLRNPRTEPLPVHKTNSEYNTLARYGFEVAYIGNNLSEPEKAKQTEAEIPAIATSSPENFEIFLEANFTGTNQQSNPCDALNNQSEKKGWRIPNQKELAIMMRLGILTSHGNDQFFTSCTAEYWDSNGKSTTPLNLANYRLAGARVWDSSMTQDLYQNMRRFRCVRDRQSDESSE